MYESVNVYVCVYFYVLAYAYKHKYNLPLKTWTLGLKSVCQISFSGDQHDEGVVKNEELSIKAKRGKKWNPGGEFGVKESQEKE